MSEPSQTSSVPTISPPASPSPTETGSSDSFFDFSAPVSWIFIPILILALVAASLACLTLRRRRRRRRRLGPNGPWPGSHPRSDLERAQGANRARGPYARGARAWAPRSSEGLNELGEAPPAYEPKAKPGQSLAHERDGSVELQQLERVDGASSPTPPQQQATDTAATTANLPPDYNTVRASGGLHRDASQRSILFLWHERKWQNS
ncbi:hypothetical protein ACHAQH_001373 [Verticillium albo-atrum]